MTNSNTSNQGSFEDVAWKKHDAYIDAVHNGFKKASRRLAQETEKQINATPNISEEARKKILLDEQAQLDKLLAELKHKVNQANRELYQLLENYDKKKNKDELDKLLSVVNELD
jgi:hypothetical protein